MLSIIKYKSIYENVELADKYFFKPGLLNDEDKKIIFDITNKDKFTALVAALYKSLKRDSRELLNGDLKVLNQFHEDLKNYNKKIFPLPINDFYDIFKNNSKFHILDLYSMLKKRNEIIHYYNKLPSIAKRNLKINKPYENEFYYTALSSKIRDIVNKLDNLKNILEPQKYDEILKKTFTSKDNIDTIIDKLESFNDSFSNIEKIDKDSIIDFAEHYELKYFKYFNDSVIVVQIENQEEMEEIAGSTLWCFARPHSCESWDLYTNYSEDLPLLIFNFNYEYYDINFLMLYLTKDDSFVNSNNIYIQDETKVDERTVIAVKNTIKKL